jgi:hypothetical protein
MNAGKRMRSRKEKRKFTKGKRRKGKKVKR